MTDAVLTWESYNGAVHKRSEFNAAVDAAMAPAIAKALKARAAQFEGDYVLWDPENDEEGFLLVGNDADVLARAALDHHSLEVDEA